MSSPTLVHSTSRTSRSSRDGRDRSSVTRSDRSFLWCGFAASIAFLVADVASGTLASRSPIAFLVADVVSGTPTSRSPVRSYSFAYNSISELLVPSAPPFARFIGVAVMALSDVLGMAFGFGGVLRATSGVVSAADRPRRGGRFGATVAFRRGVEGRSPFQERLRVRLFVYRGGFLMGMASTCNLLSATVFPQDVRGEALTRSGSMHLLLLAASILFSLPAMWNLTRAINSDAFKRYTIFTVSLMFAGALSTPLLESRGLLGVAERCSAYAYVVWQGVLSITLLIYTSARTSTKFSF